MLSLDRLINVFKKVIALLIFCSLIGIIVAVIHIFRSTAIPIYVQDHIGYTRKGLLPSLRLPAHLSDVNYMTSALVQPRDPSFCKEPVFLIVLILTFAPHARARDTIRKSWAHATSYKGKSIRRLFLFGYHDDKDFDEQARHEGKIHNDVLQMNVTEGYRSLTNKTMAALHWIHTRCTAATTTSATYILKTDDDSFNVPESYVDYLVKRDRSSSPLAPLVGGYCFTVLPDRRQDSKYYTSLESYPSKTYYPTYCAGPAYTLSLSALPLLLNSARRARYLTMEDVFITGICRELAGVSYTQITGAVVDRKLFTACNMKRGVAKSLHRVVPEDAYAMYKVFNSTPHGCTKHDIKKVTSFVIFYIVWIFILYDIFVRKFD